VTAGAPGARLAGQADLITPSDIRRTYDLISPYVRRTPVIEIDPADLPGPGHASPGNASPGHAGPGFRLALKLEELQRAGSFKARGAFANMLLRDVPAAGVVAASGGNHGVAVAYAAHRLGVPAKIFVPTISAPAKIARIRSLGASLVVGGDRYADALAAAESWAAGSGALPVHAFDQRETLLGQGSVGLELGEQVPGLDTVLVPVGGGGLIGGIAAYFAGAVRVVAVEPAGAPTLATAREHGRPADAPTGSVAADALAPRRVGDLMFPLAQAYVSDVVLVEDEAIRAAQRALWQAVRVVAEPAGAAGAAALVSGAYRPAPGERVAVVISGANTTLSEFDPAGPHHSRPAPTAQPGNNRPKGEYAPVRARAGG
jgi:threonine dehydratase